MATAPEAAQLVDDYLPLARKIAAKWARVHLHLSSEFESAAAMELWRTATAFDHAKGVRFATMLHRKCRFAFLNLLRRERAKAPLAFLPQAGPVVDGEEFRPIDLAVSRELAPDEVVELAEEVARLPDLLAVLDPERRELVIRHIVEGETLAELGAVHGTSRGNVSQLVRKDLAKMRKAAGE